MSEASNPPRGLRMPRETRRLVGSMSIPFVGALLLVLFTCAVLFRGVGASAEERTRLAVSVVPLRFLVETLAGEEVEVVVAVPPGASPATHAPSDAEMAALRRAARYFSVGVPMERGAWFGSITEGPSFVDLREGLELRAIDGEHEHAHDHEHEHDDVDPHVWLSPRALSTMAGTIAASLQELRPGEAKVIAERLASLRRQLRELEVELAAFLEPYAGRAFLVYHPSWGYYAEDHGLVQLSVETAGQEPGDAELVALRARVASLGVRVLFVQPQIHGRSAERLAASLGLSVERFDPLDPDVPANLRRVSAALVASWEEETP